jgi:hypothetical protein
MNDLVVIMSITRYPSLMARPTDRPDGKRRTVGVRFTLTPDEAEALRAQAHEQGLSVAALARGTALAAVGYEDRTPEYAGGAAT